MSKILVVEDDESISDIIKINLDMAGYDVDQAMDGELALVMIRKNKYDLIILDIILPKVDGYHLMPYITQRNIPFIVLTAKDTIKDKVHGLNMGADDYMTKPFEGVELIARVKAVLRRNGRNEKSDSFDDIKIYYDKRTVYKGGKGIDLTPKEFDLLKILVENRGIVLTREKLLEAVWEYDFEGNTRTVDMHIKRLRTKLGTDRIKTVYKVGYMFDE